MAVLSNSDNEILIEPRKSWRIFSPAELWLYRELLFQFAGRNIKIKYKQSLLGISWIIVKPLFSLVIFSVLFGKIIKLDSEGVAYPVFVLPALLFWQYFSNSITQATLSMVGNTNLIRKIYFPRIILPVSSALSALVDFLISMVLMFAFMIYYRIPPSPGVFLLPLIVVILFFFSLGPGLLFGALNVRYRDVGHAISYMVQLWFYATPVIYSLDLIPEKYRLLAFLNPMVGVVEAARVSLLGHKAFNIPGLLISLAMGIIMVIAGAAYFQRAEYTFPDII